MVDWLTNVVHRGWNRQLDTMGRWLASFLSLRTLIVSHSTWARALRRLTSALFQTNWCITSTQVSSEQDIVHLPPSWKQKNKREKWPLSTSYCRWWSLTWDATPLSLLKRGRAVGPGLVVWSTTTISSHYIIVVVVVIRRNGTTRGSSSHSGSTTLPCC